LTEYTASSNTENIILIRFTRSFNNIIHAAFIIRLLNEVFTEVALLVSSSNPQSEKIKQSFYRPGEALRALDG